MGIFLYFRDKTDKPKSADENDKVEKVNIMDKPPTPILDSKDIHLEPTSSLTSNSSGKYSNFNLMYVCILR